MNNKILIVIIILITVRIQAVLMKYEVNLGEFLTVNRNQAVGKANQSNVLVKNKSAVFGFDALRLGNIECTPCNQ